MSATVPATRLDSPFVEYTAVTPAIAGHWLTRNTDNRSIRETRVRQYARDMTDGRWTTSNDLICFDVDGRLVNGQHRLTAVVVSGTVQSFAVQWNTPLEAHPNLDTGVARTAADHLRFAKEAQPHLLAAAAKLARLWQTGAIYQSTLDHGVSSGEIEDFVKMNPSLRDSVQIVARNRSSIDGHPTPLVVAHLAIAGVNGRQDADCFVERLATLIGEREGSPILALQSRLRRIRANRTRVENREYLALFLKAYNYDVRGRSITTIATAHRGDFVIPTPLKRTPR
jgi:hypothetical protein